MTQLRCACAAANQTNKANQLRELVQVTGLCDGGLRAGF